MSDEITKDLTEGERILLACTGPHASIRPVLLCVMDTAMRISEMRQLRWKDVDLMNSEIAVQTINTKTGRARVVPITARLHAELSQLKAIAGDDPEALVFRQASINQSFASACRVAGVEGFRLGDVRQSRAK